VRVQQNQGLVFQIGKGSFNDQELSPRQYFLHTQRPAILVFIVHTQSTFLRDTLATKLIPVSLITRRYLPRNVVFLNLLHLIFARLTRYVVLHYCLHTLIDRIVFDKFVDVFRHIS